VWFWVFYNLDAHGTIPILPTAVVVFNLAADAETLGVPTDATSTEDIHTARYRQEEYSCSHQFSTQKYTAEIKFTLNSGNDLRRTNSMQGAELFALWYIVLWNQVIADR
jgi:hypothetical protein